MPWSHVFSVEPLNPLEILWGIALITGSDKHSPFHFARLKPCLFPVIMSPTSTSAGRAWRCAILSPAAIELQSKLRSPALELPPKRFVKEKGEVLSALAAASLSGAPLRKPPSGHSTGVRRHSEVVQPNYKWKQQNRFSNFILLSARYKLLNSAWHVIRTVTEGWS